VRRLLLPLLLLSSCSKTEDEAAIRAREKRELESKLSETEITLYRVAKTALRSLPPRDAVRTAVGARTELPRDDWATLVEADPALAAHKNRVGLFIVSVQLRELLIAGTVALVAVLAAKGGGHLAGAVAEPWTVPKTPIPFTSPADFVRECRDILGDDEDRHPTLTVSLLPASVQQAIRDQSPEISAAIASRIASPAFEHLLLGLAWFKLKPEFALYELHRGDAATLAPLDAAVLRLARSWLYAENRWHYLALDDLGAVDTAALQGDTKAVVDSLVHLQRYRNYEALGRKEDAAKALEVAKASGGNRSELAAAAHLLGAKIHLDRHEFKKCAGEIRAAAELMPEDKKAEAVAIAEKLEKELPESLAPGHLVVWAWSLLFKAAADEAVDPRLATWADSVRDRLGERVAEWKQKMPAASELKDKAGELWQKVRR
jgi:hypothetical protein